MVVMVAKYRLDSFKIVRTVSKLSGHFQNFLDNQIGLIRMILSSYAQKFSRRAKIFRIATLACYRGFWASEHIIDPYSSGRMRGSDGGQVCVGVQIMLGDGFKISIRSYLNKFGGKEQYMGVGTY